MFSLRFSSYSDSNIIAAVDVNFCVYLTAGVMYHFTCHQETYWTSPPDVTLGLEERCNYVLYNKPGGRWQCGW